VNYETTIKGKYADCADNKGRQCGSFWVYDLDDLEDTTSDSMTTKAEYDSSTAWKYNQDVDIIVSNLVEEKDYPYIYCYAEDDEEDGVGDNPNKMMFDDVANAGPSNVHTIKTGIGTVQTLDESPPTFTKLAMLDPTASNDRIIVTFSLNEAGTKRFGGDHPQDKSHPHGQLLRLGRHSFRCRVHHYHQAGDNRYSGALRGVAVRRLLLGFGRRRQHAASAAAELHDAGLS